MIKTLAEEWADFEQAVIPHDAPNVQRKEMRRGFYAGAQTMLSLMNHASSEYFSEEEGAEMLDALDQELKDFLSKVGKIY